MKSDKQPPASGAPRHPSPAADPGAARVFADLVVPTPEQAAEFIDKARVTREALTEAYAAERQQVFDAEPVELLRALLDYTRANRRPPALPTLRIVVRWQAYLKSSSHAEARRDSKPAPDRDAQPTRVHADSPKGLIRAVAQELLLSGVVTIEDVRAANAELPTKQFSSLEPWLLLVKVAETAAREPDPGPRGAALVTRYRAALDAARTHGDAAVAATPPADPPAPAPTAATVSSDANDLAARAPSDKSHAEGSRVELPGQQLLRFPAEGGGEDDERVTAATDTAKGSTASVEEATAVASPDRSSATPAEASRGIAVEPTMNEAESAVASAVVTLRDRPTDAAKLPASNAPSDRDRELSDLLALRTYDESYYSKFLKFSKLNDKDIMKALPSTSRFDRRDRAWRRLETFLQSPLTADDVSGLPSKKRKLLEEYDRFFWTVADDPELIPRLLQVPLEPAEPDEPDDEEHEREEWPKIDPELLALVPRPSARDLAAMRELTVREGKILIPILVRKCDGVLIDGHTRLQIARELGLKHIPAILLPIHPRADLRERVLQANTRRHSSAWQKVHMAAAWMNIESERAKQRMGDGGRRAQGMDTCPHPDQGPARDVIAKRVGLGSGRQLDRGLRLLREAPDEVKAQLDVGTITIGAAYRTLFTSKSTDENAQDATDASDHTAEEGATAGTAERDDEHGEGEDRGTADTHGDGESTDDAARGANARKERPRRGRQGGRARHPAGGELSGADVAAQLIAILEKLLKHDQALDSLLDTVFSGPIPENDPKLDPLLGEALDRERSIHDRVLELLERGSGIAEISGSTVSSTGEGDRGAPARRVA